MSQLWVFMCLCCCDEAELAKKQCKAEQLINGALVLNHFLSLAHIFLPSFQHQLPLSVSLSLAFLLRSINRGMDEPPSQLTMKQTSSAAAVVLETVVLSLRHDGFKSFISIMRIPLLKWHA